MKGKKRRGGLTALSALWATVLWLNLGSFCLAAEENRLPPLIQATTLEGDYRAAVSLELAVTPLQKEEDFDRAFVHVLPSCVRVQAGDHYGSGCIYKMLEEEIVIVTNRHVLAYWGEESYVTFFDGRVLEGKVMGVSEDFDVGFISVSTEELSYEELLSLRNIRLADRKAKQGEKFFAVDVASQWNMPVKRDGEILSPSVFLEAFQAEMIYAQGRAYPGMSGCGIFDGFGTYLGMLTGGTLEGEIAAVPAKSIQQAYQNERRHASQDGLSEKPAQKRV